MAATGGALLPLKNIVAPGGADAQAPDDSGIAAHQWVMVIDLRRCENKQKCMKACRREHSLHEGQEWIKTYEMEDASGQSYFMPKSCMHCDEPPCVNVCPVGATYKVEDGVVLVDQDRCIGCRMCMAACPYDVRVFNWEDPLPAQNTLGKPTPEFPVPQQKGTVGKCEMCVHNTRVGKLPHCVKACPNNALYIGDRMNDLATDGDKTVKLSDLLKDNDAFHYKEELNTHPRVYYIAGHGQDSG
jgi:molybdopterin-containing oxidoreductase family iron-sulfur binding subunit